MSTELRLMDQMLCPALRYITLLFHYGATLLIAAIGTPNIS